MEATNQASSLASLSLGPAELELLRPVMLRVTRLANALFGAYFADCVLFDGERPWRASGLEMPELAEAPVSAVVRDAESVVWIPDLQADSRFAGLPAAAARSVHGCVGGPIRIAGGVSIGAVSVLSLDVLPYDPERAALLMDLADIMGFECDRIRGMADHAALISQLSRSEQRLKLAVENADLCIYEIDYGARELIEIGDGAPIFGVIPTYEEVVADPYSTTLPEDRPIVEASWARHVTEGTPHISEWRINRPDKVVWVNAAAEVYYDEAGNALRMIGSFQDITDRKLSELAVAEAKSAAEEANRAKSAFLATMSHEIRTPLNGVLGMAQAMAADALSPIQRERLDVVRQSGESLLAILNDVLDLSKIEAGRLELEEVPFELAEIARGAHATFTALANKKGLSFCLDIDRALGVYCGDSTRTRQVLYNLISNALKFTEAGEIRVTMEYDGADLVTEVRDTGIGMSPDVVARLFTSFTQADASTTRRFGGTGLGLSICRQLADLMGGEISASSVEGEGSTFLFRVPIARVGDGKTLAGVESPRPPEPTGLDIRVLAAEDNAVNQLVLKTLLLQIGVEPVIVENGKQALEAWEAGDWDIILMDVQMPVMDGPAAVRAIREREAATGRHRTPILALTANAMSHQIAEYMACGMDDHVVKPIEAQKLFQALQSALETPANTASRAAG